VKFVISFTLQMMS